MGWPKGVKRGPMSAAHKQRIGARAKLTSKHRRKRSKKGTRQKPRRFRAPDRERLMRFLASKGKHPASVTVREDRAKAEVVRAHEQVTGVHRRNGIVFLGSPPAPPRADRFGLRMRERPGVDTAELLA